MAGLFTPKDAAMNIAIVTINQEHAAMAGWLAAQDFSGSTLTHWQIEPQPMVAEQVLDALVEQWQRTPAEVVLFLRARLAMNCRPAGWRLHGASICGDFVRYSNRKRAQIPLGKCANGDAANRKTPAMPFAGTSGGSR